MFLEDDLLQVQKDSILIRNPGLGHLQVRNTLPSADVAGQAGAGGAYLSSFSRRLLAPLPTAFASTRAGVSLFGLVLARTATTFLCGRADVRLDVELIHTQGRGGSWRRLDVGNG